MKSELMRNSVIKRFCIVYNRDYKAASLRNLPNSYMHTVILCIQLF